MAIIEFAHITLTSPWTSTSPDLLTNLIEVKRVIEDYSGLPTLFYKQLNDPTIMYVIGAWPNQDRHMRGFEGSEMQAGIIDLIKHQMGIDWMYYLNIEQETIALDAEVLAVIKVNFDRGQVDQDTIEKAVGTAIESGAVQAVSAWNLHKHDEEDDVFVHFSGWKSLDEAATFVENVQKVEGWSNTAKGVDGFYITKVNLN